MKVTGQSVPLVIYLFVGARPAFPIILKSSSFESLRRMSNTADVVPIISPRESRLRPGLQLWQGVILLALMVWLYAAITFHLAQTWITDLNYQHGIFVPLFVAFVIWQDRKRLREIPVSPSWTGLAFIALAMLMAIFGTLGAELSFPRASLVILLAGLILLFRGWKFFRAVLFPWAFLFLMIPIPVLLMNHITFPLQLLASKLATGLLELAQVPVLREGNLLHLATRTEPLDVAEACSGIRSMLTLVTLSMIYGYLLEPRIWVRVALVVLAFPIAIIANSFRIFGTGMLVESGHPDLAEGFLHTFSGEVIFVAALVMLFVCHRLMVRMVGAPKKTVEPETVAPPVAPFAGESTANASLRFALAVALMLPAAVALQAVSRPEYFPARTPLSSFPLQIDGWSGTPGVIAEEDLKILGYPEYVIPTYDNALRPEPWIQLYIAYYSSQRAGDTIHSPDHCLPGAGWIPTSRETIQIPLANGAGFRANRYVVEKGLDRLLVLYWFQAHGREVASEYSAKYYLVADSIHMNRSDGALVRIITPMMDGETAVQAQARLMGLGSKIIPMLDSYIPR
jgi:exosortase D (VPLPA-CTERM-specific)